MLIYVTQLSEFSVILFNLPKVYSLGEIGKIRSYLPYVNFNVLNEAVCWCHEELMAISATFSSVH